MHKKSVTERFVFLAAALAAIVVPAIGGADERPDENTNVVGSAVEVPSTIEVSNAVTSGEVIVTQENGRPGEAAPPEVSP